MFRIQITTPDTAPVSLAARSAHEAYRLTLSRFPARGVVEVENEGIGGLIRLWLAGDRTRIMIADGEEHFAADPEGAGDGTEVEFHDAAGQPMVVPASRTVGRDRALVALADWLDGGQRTAALSWE